MLLSSFDDGFEGLWLVDGELCQYFAVKTNLCSLEAGNQARVGSAVQAGCGVDTGVPQLAESSLAVTSVIVGINQRTGNGLLAALDT